MILLLSRAISMAGGIAHTRDRKITPGLRVFLDYFRTLNLPLCQSRTAAR
jgi:hypothetical protein